MSENIFGILIILLTTSIIIMQYEREYIWNTY